MVNTFEGLWELTLSFKNYYEIIHSILRIERMAIWSKQLRLEDLMGGSLTLPLCEINDLYMRECQSCRTMLRSELCTSILPLY